MTLSKSMCDYDISDLLGKLHSAKCQINDCVGNAWIVPAISKAIIFINLLEDKIHALEIEKGTTITGTELCERILERLDTDYDIMQSDGKSYDVVTIDNLKKIMIEEGANLTRD